MNKAAENSGSELKRLAREKAILQEKSEALEKSYENLKTQYEYLQFKTNESSKEWVTREEELMALVKSLKETIETLDKSLKQVTEDKEQF